MEYFFKMKVEKIHQIYHELKLKYNNQMILARLIIKEHKIFQIYKEENLINQLIKKHI